MRDDRAVDRIELQDVLLNYAAGVDERDRERYRACFCDDVTVVGFGERTFHGVDDWLDYVWVALEQYSTTQHLLGPVYAEIDGNSARTRCDVQATHFLADGGGRFTLWATYKSELRRLDSGWKIARHELVVCGSSTD